MRLGTVWRVRRSGSSAWRRRWGASCQKRLLIYAFGARLGGAGVLTDARALADQSGIPTSNLLLINRQSTYAHNDPAGAYPRNVFFAGLMRFLGRVTR